MERTRSRSKITTVGTDNMAIIIYKKSHAIIACVDAKISHPRWGVRSNNPSPASPAQKTKHLIKKSGLVVRFKIINGSVVLL